MTALAPEIPKEVVLHGIGFRVTAADGMVAFWQEIGWGRITFERRALCWRVSARDAMACHVEKAFSLVVEWYGPDHTEGAP